MEIKPNNIYLGDCYELIKYVPDHSVDLVIIDPPYEFVMGGKGHSELGGRKYKSKGEIYALDTELTKKKLYNGYSSGGGCFGTEKRAYHSQLAPTNITKARKEYDLSDSAIYHCAGDSIITTCLVSLLSQFVNEKNGHIKVVENYVEKEIVEHGQ